MHASTTTKNFSLGQTVITPDALENLDAADVLRALQRHARGDWGEVPAEDRAANERSIIEGCRLLSAYTDRKGIKFWIITEADRSLTSVLLPGDF